MDAVEPGKRDTPASQNLGFSSLGPINLAELHPLVGRAADPLWGQGDYGGAVEAAWYAIRDQLRDLLDSSLDGVRLVNLIGENEPNLLFTDFVSETEQSMHRGIVRLLAGIALYVRNPMSHENRAPHADDPARCFEYLAVMSLCARHLALAVHPTTLEQIVAEASQLRFSATSEAVADLVGALPSAQLPALVTALGDAFQIAFDEADRTRAANLREVYFGCLKGLPQDAPAIRRGSRISARLLSDDSTFDAGIELLTECIFKALAARHQAKVVRALVSDVRAARSVAGRTIEGGHYFHPLLRIFGGLGTRDRAWVLRAVTDGLLRENEQAQAYAIRLFGPLTRRLSRDEMRYPASAFAQAMIETQPDSEIHRAARSASFSMTLAFSEMLSERLDFAIEHYGDAARARLRGNVPLAAEQLATTVQWNIRRDKGAD